MLSIDYTQIKNFYSTISQFSFKTFLICVKSGQWSVCRFFFFFQINKMRKLTKEFPGIKQSEILPSVLKLRGVTEQPSSQCFKFCCILTSQTYRITCGNRHIAYMRTQYNITQEAGKLDFYVDHLTDICDG